MALTVRELIALLQTMPQNEPVEFYHEFTGELVPVKKVTNNHDEVFGDAVELS